MPPIQDLNLFFSLFKTRKRNGQPKTNEAGACSWTRVNGQYRLLYLPGKTTGGYGVPSRSGFCGSKTLRVVHVPTGRAQGHYWGPRGAGKFWRSKVNHVKNFQTEKAKKSKAPQRCKLVERWGSWTVQTLCSTWVMINSSGVCIAALICCFGTFEKYPRGDSRYAVVPLQASGMIASPPLQCCRKKCHSYMIWSQGWRFWIL